MTILFSEIVRTVVGRLGNHQLLIRNYLFRKHYSRGDDTFWVCSYYHLGKCKCRCRTTIDKRLFMRNFIHTHEPNMVKNMVLPFVNEDTYRLFVGRK